MKIVGQIRFDSDVLDVYDSLDTPYFLASEVFMLLNYSPEKGAQILEEVELDEQIPAFIQLAGQNKQVRMINELGLYNILGRSNKTAARKWRRIIYSNLIMMRKNCGLSIDQQVQEWNASTNNLFIDQDTGILMEYKIIPGWGVEEVAACELN